MMKKILKISYLLVLTLILISGYRVKAQHNIQHLTQLVDTSEELASVYPSPDGRWAAYYTWFENALTSISIVETSHPFKKVIIEGVKKHFFISDRKIAFQLGKVLVIRDLLSGAEKKIECVSKIEFLEEKKLLLVHFDSTKQNKLEVYDQDLSLKQSIGDVIRWINAKEGLVVWSRDANYKLFKIVDSGRSKVTLWLSDDEILNVMDSGSALGGFVVNSKTSLGPRVYFVKEGRSALELTDHDFQGYSLATVNPSSDKNAIYLKFRKTVPKKDQLVDIWYGKEADLSHYIRDENLTKDILWYPEKNNVYVFNDDFTGYTAVGHNNLFLKMKKKRDLVDIHDDFFLPNKERIYLWNSQTHNETLLPLDDGHMNIDPKGKMLLIKGSQKWMMYNMEKLEAIELDLPINASPYYANGNKIVWIARDEIWEQDILSLEKRKRFVLKTDKIEVYKPKVVYSGIGVYRLSEYLEDPNEFVLITKDTATFNTSYVHWKNNKAEVIIPNTSDRIQYFGMSTNQRSFFWIEDNFNKPFSIMVREKSSKAVPVYVSNKADEKVGAIRKIKLSYRGANGEQLQASLYLPAGFDDQKKYPVVLSIYEDQQRFMNKFLIPTFKNDRGINARLLLESGYLVMFPDISYGDQGPGRSAMICIDNVLDELKKLPFVDMKKVGMMGQSFGGYETNFIAGQSDRFAAFISGNSVSDIVHNSYAFNYNWGGPDYWRYEYGQFRMNGSFVNNNQKYMDNNPLYHASKVKTPMLLWAGKSDTNVDPEETRSMFNVLRKYQKPVVGLFYKNEGHSLRGKLAQKDLSIRVLEWYDYFLFNKKDISWIDKQMQASHQQP